MSNLSSELHRYDLLLGEAQEAIARLAALQREGAAVDEVTRAGLIDALESGLRQIPSTGPKQAERVLQLAAVVKEAQQLFGHLSLPEGHPDAAEPVSEVRIDSQA